MAKKRGKHGFRNVFKKTPAAGYVPPRRFSVAQKKKKSISADELVSSVETENVAFNELGTARRKRSPFGGHKHEPSSFLLNGEPDELLEDILSNQTDALNEHAIGQADEQYGHIGSAPEDFVDDNKPSVAEDNEEDAFFAEDDFDDSDVPISAEDVDAWPDEADIAAAVTEGERFKYGASAVGKRSKDSRDLLDFADKKRRPRLKKPDFAALFTSLAFWRRKKTSKTSNKALNFAKNNKPKGKRMRRILIVSGAGLLAVAIVLVAVLVPWGKQQPADASAKADEPVKAAADMSDIGDLDGSLTMVSMDSLHEDVSDTPEVIVPKTTPDDEPLETPVPTTAAEKTPQPFTMDTLIDDFMVEADLYYNDVRYSNNHYEYTKEEIYMLAQVIHGEAKGESTTGKIAVGNVVMNRVLARGYPGSSIKSVITARGQFTGYSSSIVPSRSCRSAAQLVLDYEVWVIPQNVYFFNSHKPAGQDWGRHKFYKRVGGHNFYTDRYWGRSNKSDIPPRLFERTYKWPRFGCKPEKRVYRIQYMLADLGYDVEPDSYYGMDTVDELKKFQAKYDLEADGIAGPGTIDRLIREFGIEKFYDRFYD